MYIYIYLHSLSTYSMLVSHSLKIYLVTTMRLTNVEGKCILSLSILQYRKERYREYKNLVSGQRANKRGNWKILTQIKNSILKKI